MVLLVAEVASYMLQGQVSRQIYCQYRLLQFLPEHCMAH